MSISEVSEHSTLDSLGIDSLLVVAISSHVKSELHADLPACLLMGSTTIGDLRTHFGKDQRTTSRVLLVLLQGQPQPHAPNLFLISEGSGSAAAYLHLPDFSLKVTIYSLESPFLHCPEEFQCSMEDLCSAFVRAIQSIQPHGPGSACLINCH